jgi:ribosomal protein S18 acetylase RimI-like enzyme
MVEVRLATMKDMEKIVDLHVRSWRENYRKNISSQFLNSIKVEENRRTVWSNRFNTINKNQCVAIAEYNGNFAGFICVYLNKNSKMDTLIDNLHVEPNWRKLGVATHLINYGAKWICENSKDNRVYLEVYSENENARKFYKNIGGIQTTEEPFIVDAVDGGKTLSYHIQWESSETFLKNTSQKIENLTQRNSFTF